jgi:hypothetical protein
VVENMHKKLSHQAPLPGTPGAEENALMNRLLLTSGVSALRAILRANDLPKAAPPVPAAVPDAAPAPVEATPPADTTSADLKRGLPLELACDWTPRSWEAQWRVTREKHARVLESTSRWLATATPSLHGCPLTDELLDAAHALYTHSNNLLPLCGLPQHANHASLGWSARLGPRPMFRAALECAHVLLSLYSYRTFPDDVALSGEVRRVLDGCYVVTDLALPLAIYAGLLLHTFPGSNDDVLVLMAASVQERDPLWIAKGAIARILALLPVQLHPFVLAFAPDAAHPPP